MPIIVVSSKRKCPNTHVGPNNTLVHALNSNTVSGNGIFSFQNDGDVPVRTEIRSPSFVKDYRYIKRLVGYILKPNFAHYLVEYYDLHIIIFLQTSRQDRLYERRYGKYIYLFPYIVYTEQKHFLGRCCCR